MCTFLQCYSTLHTRILYMDVYPSGKSSKTSYHNYYVLELNKCWTSHEEDTISVYIYKYLYYHLLVLCIVILILYVLSSDLQYNISRLVQSDFLVLYVTKLYDFCLFLTIILSLWELGSIQRIYFSLSIFLSAELVSRWSTFRLQHNIDIVH